MHQQCKQETENEDPANIASENELKDEREALKSQLENIEKLLSVAFTIVAESIEQVSSDAVEKSWYLTNAK